MKKKEQTEGADFKIPLGAEFEMVVGNFSIVLKSNKGENINKLSLLAVNIYSHVLHLNNLNVDEGVQ